MDKKELEKRELSEEELEKVTAGMEVRTPGFTNVFGSIFAPFFEPIAKLFFGDRNKK